MRRPRIGQVVVLMPSGFTLGNLCLGMLAILAAFRGDLANAGLFVVLGGVVDVFDGRVARATNTGSRFGEELDSLADLVSFGVAPAMIMYTAVLRDEGLHWLWAFIFIAAAAIRLAKFNVEHAGRQKTHFYGLPSPAAGMTLATYYWFSQTSLYTESWIGNLPWQTSLRALMVVLAMLMMSNVQYPAVPTIGFRSIKGLLGLTLVVSTLIGIAFFPREFFFPALIAYVAYGLIKTAVMGLLERRIALSAPPPPEIEVVDSVLLHDGDGVDAAAEVRNEGQRRRRRRRPRQGPPRNQGDDNAGNRNAAADRPPRDSARRPRSRKPREDRKE